MTDAFDRRFRDWLEDRDPGPLPSSLRENAARVSVETPIPAASRVWQTVIGAGRTGRAASPVRLVFVLVVLGLLVAGVAALLAAGSRPSPLTAWKGYVLGQQAPDLDFGSVAGDVMGGEPTISVDDLPQFVVALYFPGDATAERTAADTRALAEASEQTPAGTAFLVIPSASSPLAADTVDRVHAAGMLTAALPPDWPGLGQAQSQPVLIITDRRGVVAYVYVGQLPAADRLIDDLDRASVP